MSSSETVPDEAGAPATDRAEKVVAVWRSDWLPPSETFIRDQVAALTTWRAHTMTLRRLTPSLDAGSPYAPVGGSSALSRLLRGASRATGYRVPFAAEVRRSRSRLVHAHFGPDAIAALPVARTARVPLVVTFHGYDVTAAASSALPRGVDYEQSIQPVFAYAHSLIAVSEHVRKHLEALGAPPEKIVQHYIGVPSREVARPPGERAGIVFVGRLVEKKGLSDLLLAVAGLPDDLRGTQVTVIGFGPLKEGLEEQARGLGVDALFTGRLESSAVMDALDRAAVYCAPSRTAASGDSEGLPISILEAARAGASIVATRHAGIPEFVRDGVTGLLVDEADVRGLTSALTSVLRDEELRRRLSESASQLVAQEFDSTAQALKLEAIYDAAVG